VLLLGLGIFALFGTVGAFAHSLRALLVWRFLMGAGAGASQVMALAMVRDLFEGHEARAKQSYVNLVSGVAPIIAPTVGVWIALFGGWRAIYGLLAAGGAVLLAVATLKLSESSKFRGGTLTMRGTLSSYARVVQHPVTMGYAIVLALSFGSLFAYVAGSSLILIDLLGVSRRAYGFLFASTSFGLMAGSFINARLSRRHVSHTLLLTVGLTTITATSLVLALLTLTGTLRVPVLIPLLLIGNVGQGILRPNAALGGLEPLPEIAGVASAVLTGLQYLVGALAAAMVAELFDGRSAIAVTGAMAGLSIASFAVYLFVVRPAERGARAPVEDAVVAV
jgi:DHA1 family bicyclomycin/chloramphenicol resistance-like MFS transporter